MKEINLPEIAANVAAQLNDHDHEYILTVLRAGFKQIRRHVVANDRVEIMHCVSFTPKVRKARKVNVPIFGGGFHEVDVPAHRYVDVNVSVHFFDVDGLVNQNVDDEFPPMTDEDYDGPDSDGPLTGEE